MASSSRSRKDITEKFTVAAKQLQPGELVKDDFFTLFEAVGALEIMDPKMDSGYVPPDEVAGLDSLPPRALTPSEAIGIMDQLLCLEITWLDGYPLAQTLFTSLHIHRLLSPDKDKNDLMGKSRPVIPWEDQDKTPDNVLLVYCIATIKCCELASHLVQSQTYYEEEDFVTHLFGVELLPDLKTDVVTDMIMEVHFWIAQYDCERDISRALSDRFRMRLLLLQTLSGSAARWGEVQSTLELIRESHDLGEPVPNAFSEKVQRHLATSTPPRPMMQTSFESAYRQWKTLCEDCVTAFRLTPRDVIKSPYCLQRAVWTFAQTKHPSTLARAQMQDLLFADNTIRGVVAHSDLILMDMQDLVLTGDPLVDPQNFEVEVPSDPRHICATLFRDFMEKVVEEYLNLYRMVCQNHCRTRRTFTQAISIWDAIQQEADRVDGEILKYAKSGENRMFLGGRGPLLTWASYHTSCLLAWTVQLGFETEIYLPDEYGKMYWYLMTFCSQRAALIKSMKNVVEERKRKFRNDKKANDCRTSQHFLTSLTDSTQASRFLAAALWHLYHLLYEFDIIPRLKRDFAKPDLLYEARMKNFIALPYGYVTEDVPGLQESEAEGGKSQTTSRPRDFESTCREIDTRIKEAKEALVRLKEYKPVQAKFVGTEEQWNKEIRQMESSCVAVTVAVLQLKRFHSTHGPERLGDLVEARCEKKYHDWWVVPTVKEKVKK